MLHRFPVMLVVPLLLGVGLPCRARTPVGDQRRGLQTGPVTFKKVLPRPGLIRISTESTVMTFSISDGARTLKTSTTGSKRKSEKLLAVLGSTATKLEVTYHKLAKVEVQNGKTRNVPSPLVGKTYVVEAKDGNTVVSARAGKPVPAAEQALVAEDYRSLGKPNFMLDGLPSGPIQIGARVPSMEEAMKKSFIQSMGGKPGEQWQISDPVVTLTGRGRAEGAQVAFLTFEMAMTMSQPGGFSMTMHMKGTVTIRLADGWPIAMIMSGPMDIMGTKNAGQMNMSQRTQYK